MLTKQIALALLVAIGSIRLMADPSLSEVPMQGQPVATGAEVLVASSFSQIAGKRVGLISNQTGRVRGEHLADLLSRAPNVKLTALFAPEHGFRGAAEAGAMVGGDTDAKTGLPIYSLYGASRKPTLSMLRNVDVLVFDIQDVGARFYTYISTMGLAMRAAAAAGIPFVVLDRPNPLGGEYVSGFVLEAPLRTFVGQYPIPIVHGMTVGELARMIKGERWLDGLETLDLRVVEMQGWRRAMRWPQTQLAWVATSPNIPAFESALFYPGMGMVGETEVSEGRGTPTPFSLFGAPWLDAARAVTHLNALGLRGVRFEATSFTPRSIPGVAAHPRFEGKTIKGVHIVATDVGQVEPLEIGIHVLSMLIAEARSQKIAKLFGNLAMFHAIAGTKRLYRMLANGSRGADIVAAWQNESAHFKVQRAPYLLY
jgi:uncharacterized protein YbbC (DUF1343 family)